MHVDKRLDLGVLGAELTAAAVPYSGLGLDYDPGSGPSGPSYAAELFTYTPEGTPTELPPAAGPVVDAHVAPPLLVEYAGEMRVDAIVRTTDAVPLEVFRFPCEQKRLYQANLTISGVDAGNFASKIMEGRFTWKRTTGANAVMVGITVVSDIHDTAASSWAPNAVPQGADIVFTVAGAAGRVIDWLLVGIVGTYAPGGL